MKSREALYKLKLERLQKEEAFFDQLQMIHSETLRCLPSLPSVTSHSSVTCLPCSPLESPSSSPQKPPQQQPQEQQRPQEPQGQEPQGQGQDQFLTELAVKTDPMIQLSRILPPVTRAHLPSASLRYFIRLKKNGRRDLQGDPPPSQREDKEAEGEQEEEEEREREEEEGKGDEISVETVETGAERRQRLKRIETTAHATASLGYATRKTALSALTSPPPVALSSVSPTLSSSAAASVSSFASVSASASGVSVSPLRPSPRRQSQSQSPCPAYYNPPPWLSMPQLSHLSESIQSNKLASLELVSHVPSLHFSRSKYLLQDSLFTIGTSPSADCCIVSTGSPEEIPPSPVVSPAVSAAASAVPLLRSHDPRHLCHISSIHAVLSVSLFSQQQQPQPQQEKTQQQQQQQRKSAKSHHNDSFPSLQKTKSATSSSLSGASASVSASVSVSVVDNHSLWGTYVVTRNGVHKVSTIVTKGYSLQSGDLLCLGLVRNGPKTMSSVDANQAMVVFRLRIE
jgi:hypothetical protein